MPVVTPSFDLDAVEWRRVRAPDLASYDIDFEYSLLGYDMPSGRLDMLIRYGPGSYCRPHRHVASTATLVLQGEQHLVEHLPNGEKKTVRREKGVYALAAADAHPHDEFGGPEGGTVLLSMTAENGALFEYFDADMQNGWILTLEEYVRSWQEGRVYGAEPAAPAAAE